MAGKSLESLSNTLEQARATLVNQYVSQAHRMWDMLTPADWWNDGMTFAVASRMALLEMALIQQVRRLGVSYANETLKLVGVTPKGDVPSLVFPRDNTDPWLVAQRPADTYRSLAVKTPRFVLKRGLARPMRYSARLISGLNRRSTVCRPLLTRMFRGRRRAPRLNGTRIARCWSIAGCYIPNCPRRVLVACAWWRLTDGIRRLTCCRCTLTVIVVWHRLAVITIRVSS